jgi:hypothetical protein
MSWAIILGYVLELRYKIEAVVVGIGFIAMGAPRCCRTGIRRRNPRAGAQQLLIISVSITLTSFAAFAMAGGRALSLQERANDGAAPPLLWPSRRDTTLRLQSDHSRFRFVRFHPRGDVGELCLGRLLGWDPRDLVTIVVDLRCLHPCASRGGKVTVPPSMRSSA